MVAWGVVMTLMGLVKDFHGLLIARIFLGVAEAGLFPGIAVRTVTPIIILSYTGKLTRHLSIISPCGTVVTRYSSVRLFSSLLRP